MTPIIFVSFLISLTWVDYRYSVMRSQYHAENPSRLPPWLHRILYRYEPYRYVIVDENNQPTNHPRYFHSKQRKLMKMEAVDAFEIRSTVLVVLGLLSLVCSWAVWRIAGYAVDLVSEKKRKSLA